MTGSKRVFEEIPGEVLKIVKLPDQGCTSEVSRIVTEDNSYLLKSAFKVNYDFKEGLYEFF
jgi:hypothetical protein